MNILDIIAKKRDGKVLSKEENYWNLHLVWHIQEKF